MNLGIGGNRIIHDAPGGGDHLHPSDEGYPRMGDIIDLALFD